LVTELRDQNKLFATEFAGVQAFGWSALSAWLREHRVWPLAHPSPV
jgi:hypothetical protein